MLSNSHVLSNGPEQGMFVKKKKSKPKIKTEEVSYINFIYFLTTRMQAFSACLPCQENARENYSLINMSGKFGSSLQC